jgi:hypothetical protein
MNLQYRQGDLLFTWQEEKSALCMAIRPGDVIVKRETTSHAHRLAGGVILEASDGALYLEITQPTQVVHEAHGPLTLEPGRWLIVHQREYQPEAIKVVVD